MEYWSIGVMEYWVRRKSMFNDRLYRSGHRRLWLMLVFVGVFFLHSPKFAFRCCRFVERRMGANARGGEERR
jgi:hypothetical protein